METKQFVLLDIDYITKNRIPVIRLFGKLIGKNGGGSKIIALDRSFKPYIYIRPNDADDCINELNILELQVEKLRREDNGKLKNIL
jgi:DNA polymerase I